MSPVSRARTDLEALEAALDALESIGWNSPIGCHRIESAQLTTDDQEVTVRLAYVDAWDILTELVEVAQKRLAEVERKRLAEVERKELAHA